MKKTKNKTQIRELTEKAGRVIKDYKKTYPDVKIDKDYLPFKITEEWGECLQVYLMLTNRGRQKGKSKKEIQELFSNEFADVFGYFLAFADQEGIDLVEAFNKKWLRYLK
jgi:NTP pyrophosphatase (non-canonical NTP hydrolase)